MKTPKELVGQLYYTHGMFCASHPFATIFGVIAISALACLPLLSVPLLVYAPLHYDTPSDDYTPPQRILPQETNSELKLPRWYVDLPVGYVQQIVVKAAVLPWQPHRLIPIDSVRGPLGHVFKILDLIRNFKYTDGDSEISIADLCVRVGEVTNNKQSPTSLLPQYDCLLLSPTPLWNNDRQRFLKDAALLKTIYHKYGHQLDPPPSIQDLLFGVPWKKTGLSRYFIRNRQRPMTYAITVVFKQYHHAFLSALKSELLSAYPQSEPNANQSHSHHITHLHYRRVNYFVEYVPLLVTYVALFLYIYFSVHKIEMVKSKWGLAVSAVATVIASLLMSLSICTLLGLTPTLKGSEIFPYLGILIGLENILVLTKSVMSTPEHLNVKNRLAIGLHKEGWSITKNLAAEFFIILIGFCTLVPAIQEFCAFAVVGLFSDFFLQMFFFSTVLSIDIRRTEELPLVRIPHVSKPGSNPPEPVTPLFKCPVMTLISHRNSPDPSPQHTSRADAEAPEFTAFPNVPRRLRFIFLWARMRFVQRAIMVFSVAFILYKTGAVSRLAIYTNTQQLPIFNQSHILGILGYKSDHSTPQTPIEPIKPEEPMIEREWWGWKKEHVPDSIALRHFDHFTWASLYDNHWIKLFGHYNVSLFGKYVSILPSIHLSVSVTPDDAVKLRLPDEIVPPKPVVPDDVDPLWTNSMEQWREWVIFLVLAGITTFFLVWFGLIIWYCIIGSRTGQGRSTGESCGAQTVILRGHRQDIECLVQDGRVVVSSCLGGEVRVWNSHTGELLTVITRARAYYSSTASTPPSIHQDISHRNSTHQYDPAHPNDAIDAGMIRNRSAIYNKPTPPPTSSIHPTVGTTTTTPHHHTNPTPPLPAQSAQFTFPEANSQNPQTHNTYQNAHTSRPQNFTTRSASFSNPHSDNYLINNRTAQLNNPNDETGHKNSQQAANITGNYPNSQDNVNRRNLETTERENLSSQRPRSYYDKVPPDYVPPEDFEQRTRANTAPLPSHSYDKFSMRESHDYKYSNPTQLQSNRSIQVANHIDQSIPPLQTMHQSNLPVQTTNQLNQLFQTTNQSNVSLQGMKQSIPQVQTMHQSNQPIQTTHQSNPHIQTTHQSNQPIQPTHQSNQPIQTTHQSNQPIQPTHQSYNQYQTLNQSNNQSNPPQTSYQSNRPIQSLHQSNPSLQSPHQSNPSLQSPNQSNPSLHSPHQSNSSLQSPHQSNPSLQTNNQSNPQHPRHHSNGMSHNQEYRHQENLHCQKHRRSNSQCINENQHLDINQINYTFTQPCSSDITPQHTSPYFHQNHIEYETNTNNPPHTFDNNSSNQTRNPNHIDHKTNSNNSPHTFDNNSSNQTRYPNQIPNQTPQTVGYNDLTSKSGQPSQNLSHQNCGLDENSYEMVSNPSHESTPLCQGASNTDVNLDSGTGGENTAETSIALRDTGCIWCLASQERAVAVGCSDGRIEFWEGKSGFLNCMYEGSTAGVTSLLFVNNRLVAARLDGTLDFLQVEMKPPTPNRPHSPFTSMVKGHSRNNSLVSLPEDVSSCVLIGRIKAHFQPITALISIHQTHVATASHDHTVKIHSVDEQLTLHNLHRHSAPVTCIHTDTPSPTPTHPPVIASGSHDKTVCIWKQHNGRFIRKLTGLSGRVVSLVVCSSRPNIVCLCDDNSLHIWDRRDYHLLRRIDNVDMCSHNLVLTSGDSVVTGSTNRVHVWDLARKTRSHTIQLQCDDCTSYLRDIRVVLNNTIVCSYGRNIAIINLPSLNKSE